MAKPKFDDEFLLVAKSVTSVNNYFKRGVHLEKKTGLTIDDIIERATEDRFGLAERMLLAAHMAFRLKPKQNRLVVTRAYYAMYHAARSVVYHQERGDDHEAHAELPKYLPGDFPDRNNWENQLKDARYERNRADYDPYPLGDTSFLKTAVRILTDANQFLSVARSYLVSKGCKL